MSIRIGNYRIALVSRFFASKIHDRHGVTNICKDNMRCQFIDFSTESLFNNINDQKIEDIEIVLSRIHESCTLNQQSFKLGDYYIIQSFPRLSFHAFCLDKIQLEVDRLILANTLHADLMYVITYTERYRGYMPHTPEYKVLRYLEKNDTYPDEQLTCIGIVKSNHNDRIKSRMHNRFFQMRYGVEMYPDELLDDSKIEELKIDHYESLR